VHSMSVINDYGLHNIYRARYSYLDNVDIFCQMELCNSYVNLK